MAANVPDLFVVCDGVIFDERPRETIPTINGGTLLGIVRWASWLSQYACSDALRNDERMNDIRKFLQHFFLTYLDFAKRGPTAITEALCELGKTSGDGDAVHCFVRQWLGHSFSELPLSTRAQTLPSLFQACVAHVTTTPLSDARLLKKLVPPDLLELLAIAEKDLIVTLETTGDVVGTNEEVEDDGRSSYQKPRQQAVLATLFDCAVYEVANQLTLADQALFHQIPFIEFLSKTWERPRYCGVNDKTRAWIDRFNAGSEWFASQLISAPSVEERVKRIIFAAQLGDKLLDMRNFMSATMVTFALSHVALKKMKSSWELVPPTTVDTIDRLKSAMSHEKNYANYREFLKRIRPDEPMIPNLLVHHKDIFYDDETEQKLLFKDDDTILSFKRARSLGRHIVFLRRCKSIKYTYKKNREVSLLISKGLVPHLVYTESQKRKSQNQLYAVSAACEAYQ